MGFDLKLDEQITLLANALGGRFAFASHSHACSILSTFGDSETQGAGFELLTSPVTITARLVGDPTAPPAVLARLHGFLDEGTNLLADAHFPWPEQVPQVVNVPPFAPVPSQVPHGSGKSTTTSCSLPR